jgi:hypothetical protein
MLRLPASLFRLPASWLMVEKALPPYPKQRLLTARKPRLAILVLCSELFKVHCVCMIPEFQLPACSLLKSRIE